MESAIKNIKSTVEIAMTIIIGLFYFACASPNETIFYLLLLLYSCILFLHFASEIMREETSLRKPLLMVLFISYAAFCCISAHWPVLLLLPGLSCYHNVVDARRGTSRLALVFVSVAALFVFLLVGPDALKLIDFLYGSAILILNAVVCCLLFTWFIHYTKKLEELEKSMRFAAVNELNEKIFSHELAARKDAEVQNARLEERETISRNMHNAVGHTITSSIMALEAAQILHDISPDESMKKVKTARDKISQGLDSIRQIVRMLDPENETTTLTDLVSSMRVCAEQFVSGTAIRLKHNLEDHPMGMTIPKRHAEFVAGALMELLSNASRAAGVTTVTVFLSYNREYLKLTVSDNGCSFGLLTAEQRQNRLAGGYGLRKIEKYVRECGGEYERESTGGFTVGLTVPIAGEGNHDR